jgi:hypothetical protein
VGFYQGLLWAGDDLLALLAALMFKAIERLKNLNYLTVG